MYVQTVYLDTNGNYLSVDLLRYNKVYRLNFSDIRRDLKFENAILCKNGVMRAKKGYKLNRVVVKDEKLDLNKYRNLKMYDGTTKKYGITYKGKDYIVKYPKNSMDTSHISEYVASHFINNLGYKAHNTLLKDTTNGLCVLVEDFINTLGLLHTYADTQQSSEGTDISTKAYTYEDIQYMIKMHTKIPNYLKQQAIHQFWVMFFLDAILGNRDRHRGNWGYIVGRDNQYYVAPLFDNGGSLFPNVLTRISQYSRDSKNFIKERSEKFPACLICEKTNEGIKRTNYYFYINERNLKNNRIMLNVYKEFRSIGVDKIKSAITSAVNNSLIPDTLKSFYVDVVISRYNHIILRKPL